MPIRHPRAHGELSADPSALRQDELVGSETGSRPLERPLGGSQQDECLAVEEPFEMTSGDGRELPRIATTGQLDVEVIEGPRSPGRSSCDLLLIAKPFAQAADDGGDYHHGQKGEGFSRVRPCERHAGRNEDEVANEDARDCREHRHFHVKAEGRHNDAEKVDGRFVLG